jgi:hypothetical protein
MKHPTLYHANDFTFILGTSCGTLPAIDYDGIDESCQPFEDSSLGDHNVGRSSYSQEYFLGTRRGSRHTGVGISNDLRGKSLVPSVMKDFRCWMFMRPDL